MMRNLKKILALALALIMGLSLAVGAGAGAFVDVGDTDDYASAINLLASLDVLRGFEDGTYRPEGTYTREQFAKILYVLTNGRDDGAGMYTGEKPFPDIEADRWSAGYITWASSLGIINGRDDGKFWPTDVVKYAEACKMFLIAMGYSSSAYTYPYGFIDKAASMKFFDNIKDYTALGDANRGSIAQMSVNALFAEAPRFGTYTAREGDATSTKTKLLIMGAFGVTDESAMLSASASNALGFALTGEDQVVLDFGGREGVYTFNGNVDDLIGMHVKVWYKNSDAAAGGRLIHFIEDAGKDTVYTFTTKDLDLKKFLDSDGKTILFKSSAGSRRLTAEDPEEVFLDYKGNALFEGLSDRELAEVLHNSTYRLVDRGNDGVADVCYVTYPEFAKLTALSATKASFSYVGGADLLRGANDLADRHITLYDGAAQDDYLLITARNAVDGKTVEPFYTAVRPEVVSGVKHTKVTKGDPFDDYYFGSAAYQLLDSADRPELGLKYDLYLNAAGYVALLEEAKAEAEGAWLLVTDARNTASVSGLTSVSITGYLANGSKKTLSLDLEAIDKDIDGFFTVANGWASGSDFKEWAFKYTLGSDGKVDSLTPMTATAYGKGSYDPDKGQLNAGSGKAFLGDSSVIYNLYQDKGKTQVAVFKGSNLPEIKQSDDVTVELCLNAGEVDCAVITSQEKLSADTDQYGLVVAADRNASSADNKVYYDVTVALDGEIKTFKTKDVAKADASVFGFEDGPGYARILFNSAGKIDRFDWFRDGGFDTGHSMIDGFVSAIPNAKGLELNGEDVVLYAKNCVFYTVDAEHDKLGKIDENDVAAATSAALTKSVIADLNHIGSGDLLYYIDAIVNPDGEPIAVFIFTDPSAG